MIHNLEPQSHEEWLNLRTQGIGGSEIGSILGMDEYRTPGAFVIQKRAERAGNIYEAQNAAMNRGHDIEDGVAQALAREAGIDIIKRSAREYIVKNDLRPYLQASPDRTYWIDADDHSKGKGVVECKTTMKVIGSDDDIPGKWYMQVQWLMGVMGYTEGYLAWYAYNYTFGYVHIMFNGTLFAEMLSVCDHIWNNCVCGDEMPGYVDESDVLRDYPVSTIGKTKEVGEDIHTACQRILQLKPQKKAIEDEISKLEETVKMSFDDSEGITVDNELIATWKTAKSSMKFDADKFKAEHPDLYTSYLKEVQGSRRFIVKAK